VSVEILTAVQQPAKSLQSDVAVLLGGDGGNGRLPLGGDVRFAGGKQAVVEVVNRAQQPQQAVLARLARMIVCKSAAEK